MSDWETSLLPIITNGIGDVYVYRGAGVAKQCWPGEDGVVVVTGWQSGSFGNRVQLVAAVVVQPLYRYLSSWPIAGVFNRELGFQQLVQG